ncbi:aminodeoxychorismate synthase component I [Listeria grandensis]|uniref:Aminodeoxychorismate synthase component I n=1 Tax=Listeria grandensis TaxID=1494963 RepID=A0A7X0Y5S4_9LIST|nr:aminodeoxychorismate synthase component I [Listeria grandensis]MBC1475802.1 aminodeoxychorismate synthase component I [Listeria grandensis]MBC1937542.1 aminodeoxychorismate synthase component I [Listeria grandensis]
MKMQFDFNGKTQLFSFPEAIIQTDQLDDVMERMRQVEQAVDLGYYVAGYVGYEAAAAFNKNLKTHTAGKMPLLWFGVFREMRELEQPNEALAMPPKLDWQPTTDYTSYASGIRAIREQIAAGNTYQTNYTIRLQSDFKEDDDKKFYEQLKSAQQANYSAYLSTGRFHILSASPELFFHWKGGVIKTKPMKGTARRGMTLEDDFKARDWLAASAKNQAENVMIVDLLRNDLGQIAKPGSVKVPHLFDVERYPTVWQMTSTVVAETLPEIHLTAIFEALFPCGSITGAPKVSTMKLIAESETSPRNVYCGAIGYVTPDKEAIFNVPIRTVVIDTEEKTAEYGVGGGIVWDSRSGAEYEEVQAKAALLTTYLPKFELLESLRLEDGIYYRTDLHLKRIEKSAHYFGFTWNIDAANEALEAFAKDHPKDIWKVRLLSDKSGELTVEGELIISDPITWTAHFADKSVNSSDPFLYHKTTHRTMYEKRRRIDYDETLLWNERGEITEFINGNLVAEIDGELVTPKQSSGLLGGTMRETLLAEKTITERVLHRNDLLKATKTWLINSVRGWVDIDLH